MTVRVRGGRSNEGAAVTSMGANEATTTESSAGAEAPASAGGTPPLAVAAGLVTVFLWASAFIGIRAAGSELSPGALTLARLTVGGLVLGIVVAIRRVPLPPRADVPRLILCGVLWFGIYNIALNASEQRIDAGSAAMVVSLGPVLIAVLAGILLKEGFPRTLIVGGSVAFSGAVIIGVATSAQGLSAGVGSGLALVAAVTYAGGVISQKPLLRNTSALMVTWLACLTGAALCLPFLPQLIDGLATSSAKTIVWTLYLGVFPTAVAFTTWAYALARSSAGRLGALTYLAAPIAVLMAWMILDETPPWLALLGGALSLAGVVYSQRKR